MTTEDKKKLLADVRSATRALGRVLDGGHDLNQLTTFSKNLELLRNDSTSTLAGLAMLDALLVSEIGTDNL